MHRNEWNPIFFACDPRRKGNHRCKHDIRFTALGNHVVNGADLGMLLAGWGAGGIGDLDGNGAINGADLGLLLAAWGVCP